MRRFRRPAVGLFAVAAAAFLAIVPSPDPAGAATPATDRDSSARFLPDTAILARVNDRAIRVYDFRDRYFSANYEFRPGSDSLGRTEFLENLVSKEILGLTAREIARPLNLSERTVLEQHTETVLSNALFDRLIADSIRVTEAEVESIYSSQFGWEYHLRHIVFDDRATAERVRKDLLAKRIGWDAAAKKYSAAMTQDPTGDLGWVARSPAQGETGLVAFQLKPGELSPIVRDAEGFHLIQAVDRRAVKPILYSAVRRFIKKSIHDSRVAPRLSRLYETVRSRAHVVYDTANIRLGVAEFRRQQANWPKPDAGTFDFAGQRVVISSADTGRVLARTPTRSLTLGEFAQAIIHMPAPARPRIYNFEGFRHYLDSVFLGPERAELALSLGFDRHPQSVQLIELRREQMLVEHLYQDSILSRVYVPPAERRKYYQEHVNTFVSRPKVRFAEFAFARETAADSLLQVLRTGADPRSMLGPHPARGIVRAEIREVTNIQSDSFNNMLFHEVRPGQSTKVGPTNLGQYLVYHLLDYQGERPMAYEEVEAIVVESTENLQAEERLAAFIDRLRKKFRVESHPELVTRIRLEDPAREE